MEIGVLHIGGVLTERHAECFEDTVWLQLTIQSDLSVMSSGHSVPPAGQRKHDASLRWVTIAEMAFAKQTNKIKPSTSVIKPIFFF